MESSGISTPNLLVNLSLLLFLIMVALFLFLIALCCKKICVGKLKEKVTAKLDKAVKDFCWNGAIRSVGLAYINLCITCMIKWKDMVEKPETADGAGIGSVVALNIFLIGCAVGPAVFMLKHRHQL
jgi:hypothetical protein